MSRDAQDTLAEFRALETVKRRLQEVYERAEEEALASGWAVKETARLVAFAEALALVRQYEQEVVLR